MLVANAIILLYFFSISRNRLISSLSLVGSFFANFWLVTFSSRLLVLRINSSSIILATGLCMYIVVKSCRLSGIFSRGIVSMFMVNVINFQLTKINNISQ